MKPITATLVALVSVSLYAETAAAQPCPLEFPGATYPVMEKVLTEIDVYCL